MKLRIKRLNISNFRQIESREFKFNDYLNHIVGKNGSGKSNTLHAITWVLFGTDYSNRSVFSVVPINPDGTETEREPSVELTLSVNGTVHTLKRTLRRGGKTETYIDGTPCKTLREYNEFIGGIFETPERFRMFSNPFYFSESLHWKEQRELFMRFFPLPTNGDVIAEIAKKTAFRTDMTELGNKDIEKETDRIRHEQKGLLEEVQSLRAKIELLDEQLEGNHAVQEERLIAERDELRAEVRDYQKKMVEYTTQSTEVSNQRQMIETKIQNLKQYEIDSTKKAKQRKDLLIQDCLADLGIAQNERDHLTNKYRSRKGTLSNDCPTCGQHLTEELIDVARINHEAELKRIVADGKKAAEKIKAIELQITEIENATLEVADHAEEIAELERQLASLKTVEPVNPIDEETIERLDSIERSIAHYEINQSNLEQRKKFKEREVEISRDYEKMEAKLMDLSDMNQKRSEMLVNRVNRAFKEISVKVVDVQKNGLVKETFEVMKNGVPYRELNTAGQLEASIELTQFLKANLKVSCPLIIDNGERYTDVDFNFIDDQILIAEAVKGERLELK